MADCQALRKQAMQDSNISASARLLFVAIIDEFPNGDTSTAHLSSLIGTSKRTVRRRRAELAEQGYLSSETGEVNPCCTPADNTDRPDSTDRKADNTDNDADSTDNDADSTDRKADSTDNDRTVLTALKVLSAGSSQVPSRKKKVSTPSKKNTTPPSDSPSLRSVESGDGLPEADWGEFFIGPPDDDTQHPAVGCYRSFAEIYPSEWDRKRLIDAVGEVGTDKFSNRMGLWREELEHWQASGWNLGNLDDLLKSYVSTLEDHGLINRSDFDRSLDLPEGEDKTADELGLTHLLP